MATTTSHPASVAAPPHDPVPRTVWESTYVVVLVLVDAVAITAAALLALLTRFGFDAPPANAPYALVSLLVAPLWVTALWLGRAYEPRFLGTGPEEYRRVATTLVLFTGSVATFCYATDVALARGYVGLAAPLGLVLTLLGRRLARNHLARRRASGRWAHRALLVGEPEQVQDLADAVRTETWAGFTAVGVLLPYDDRPPTVGGVPVVGGLEDLEAALESTAADSVALAAGPRIDADVVRRVGWRLEGRQVDLLLTPSLTDVAGPRISIRPVSGLPLLHVDAPELSGARRALKTTLDTLGAGLGLVALAPLLLVVAVLVRLDSPGPAIFMQQRVGLNRTSFTIWKFRTMRADQTGPAPHSTMDKRADDPRVTRLGRFLRASSIDELPQLVNVLRGQMSLVGPRPVPIGEEGDGDAYRRLLVKPGITGLWQVSGRSSLTWEQRVRLDLYYAENWSPLLDLAILWKTLAVVLGRRGAF